MLKQAERKEHRTCEKHPPENYEWRWQRTELSQHACHPKKKNGDICRE
jgi:hypothetical protein